MAGCIPEGAGARPLLGVLIRTAALARGHDQRRRRLHALSIALARHPPFVGSAQAMARTYPDRGRLARIAAVLACVGEVTVQPRAAGEDPGVEWLKALTGEEDAAAVLLAGLLLALGERAQLDYTRELPFVRVQVDADDIALLPPHAVVLRVGGRLFVPVAVRRPLGFLPRPAREGWARRVRRDGPGLLSAPPIRPTLPWPAGRPSGPPGDG